MNKKLRKQLKKLAKKGQDMQNHTSHLPIHYPNGQTQYNPSHYAPQGQIQAVTDLITHDGQVFRRHIADGFKTWKRELTSEATPRTEWDGAPIPMSTWKTILAFFEWGQRTHRCEQVVRLFYSPSTREWKPWAFPQEKTGGLSAKEVESHPDWERQRQEIGVGFFLYGSVHHHCTAGAFQSGGDQRDEQGWSGIHFTVGKITSPHYDLHARAIIGNQRQDNVNLAEWFEVPEVIRNSVAPSLSATLAPIALAIACTPPPLDYPFPEVWKSNVVERPTSVVSVTTYGHGGRYPGDRDNYTGSYFNGASEYAYGIKFKDPAGCDQFIDEFADFCASWQLDWFDGMMVLIRELYHDMPITWCSGRCFKPTKDKMNEWGSANNATHEQRLLEDGLKDMTQREANEANGWPDMVD